MPVFFMVAEGLALLASFLLLRSNNLYRSFIFLMLSVAVAESTGFLMLHLGMKSNHVFFNFYDLLFYGWLLYYLYRFLENKYFKRTIIAFIVIHITFWLLNVLFIQGIEKLATFSYVSTSILISIGCLFYFVEVIRKETIMKIRNEPPFFIVSGFLFWAFLTALIHTLHFYFAYKNTPVKIYRHVANTTVEISNIGLYLLLTIAFIIQWKKEKSLR